jgi:hypothetical protein
MRQTFTSATRSLSQVGGCLAAPHFQEKKCIRPGPVLAALVLPLLCLSAGCRTVAPLPPVNLSEPGWTVRQGQAVWHTPKKAVEIAGDLTVATRSDGAALVQFTKTPLPLIIAQSTDDTWQIHSVPDNRTYTGRGRPPRRLIWLQLPRCLAGAAPPKPWQWESSQTNNWHLYNLTTGESLEGYLTP